MNNNRRTGVIRLMKPYMPPREEFDLFLDRIWESRQLTNDGPIHGEFEEALCNFLGVRYISLFANGTLALLFALKALNRTGEVITTPFSSPATLQAICWNGLKPAFADIDANDLNIHPEKIEPLVSSRSCAILPVHIFGEPCDVTGINALASRHSLPVVYDAAHSFGVRLNDIPVCNFGDLSVLSFHATKVFNSIEGGAIICHDRKMKEYIDGLKILKSGDSSGRQWFGLNAKMSEIQAAFGLIQLNHIEKVILARKKATMFYRELLKDAENVKTLPYRTEVDYNYTYFPVLIEPDATGTGRDAIASEMEKHGIITRKYFFPLLPELPGVDPEGRFRLPVAEKISKNILCLPLYHDLLPEEIKYIVSILLRQKR